MRPVATVSVLTVATFLAAAPTDVAGDEVFPPSAKLNAMARSVASPPSQWELRVEDMYVGFSTNLGPASERHRFDFLILYTNGLVYKGGAGHFIEGPRALQFNDETRKYHLARYRVVGNEIHITSFSGMTEVIRREGDRLNIRGAVGTPWERLPKVDGLKLQGTYVTVTQTADPIWITFAPNGVFREQGFVRYAGNLYFLERGLEAPPGGAGTYTIQDYALTLRYAGGFTTNMFFYVLPGDNVDQPRRFLINTYFFERHR